MDGNTEEMFDLISQHIRSSKVLAEIIISNRESPGEARNTLRVFLSHMNNITDLLTSYYRNYDVVVAEFARLELVDWKDLLHSAVIEEKARKIMMKIINDQV